MSDGLTSSTYTELLDSVSGDVLIRGKSGTVIENDTSVLGIVCPLLELYFLREIYRGDVRLMVPGTDRELICQIRESRLKVFEHSAGLAKTRLDLTIDGGVVRSVIEQIWSFAPLELADRVKPVVLANPLMRIILRDRHQPTVDLDGLTP